MDKVFAIVNPTGEVERTFKDEEAAWEYLACKGVAIALEARKGTITIDCDKCSMYYQAMRWEIQEIPFSD